MGWDEIGPDAQDLIWCYCGDLRNVLHRNHKFVGLELKCWALIMWKLTPSSLLRNYEFVGPQHLKECLYLAYLKAQSKVAHAEGRVV